jgi:hypothetical protein
MSAAPGTPPSRLRPVHRRAAAAKAVLVTGAAVLFAATAALARVTYAGHPKRSPHSLAAPERFVQIVRENQLQAGILAPAEAPPSAGTAQS